MANEKTAGKDDTLITIIIILSVLMLLLIPLFESRLKLAWLYLMIAESHLIGFFSFGIESLNKFSDDLYKYATSQIISELSMLQVASMHFSILKTSFHQVVLSLLVFAGAIWTYLKWNLGYQGIPTLDSLLSTEHKLWPFLIYIRLVNPLDRYLELSGVGGFMQSPALYSIRKGFLINYKSFKAEERLLDDEKAIKVLSAQLGYPTSKFVNLSPTMKYVVALAMARYALDLKFSNEAFLQMQRHVAALLGKNNPLVEKERSEALDRLDKEYSPFFAFLDEYAHSREPIDLKPAKAMVNNSNLSKLLVILVNEHNKAVKAIENNKYSRKRSILMIISSFFNTHYYENTFAFSFIRESKVNGKFPSSRIPYIKHWDRPLFYIVNNAPYYTETNKSKFLKGVSCEVSGIISHYQQEIYGLRPLPDPRVQNALDGIRHVLVSQNMILPLEEEENNDV